jgi:hypothetical protein
VAATNVFELGVAGGRHVLDAADDRHRVGHDDRNDLDTDLDISGIGQDELPGLADVLPTADPRTARMHTGDIVACRPAGGERVGVLGLEGVVEPPVCGLDLGAHDGAGHGVLLVVRSPAATLTPSR